MPRTARFAPGGLIYHVLNRGVGRMRLFEQDADYEAFERILARTLDARPMRLLGFCIMPNHWHLVLWPEHDGDLGVFLQKLTTTHVANWQKYHGRAGQGHVYQGRFKSFPVETDEHFYQVMRYVERNAMRAGSVATSGDWRWCSLWRRLRNSPADRRLLSAWPLQVPDTWTQFVDEPQTDAELSAIRQSIVGDLPLGTAEWVRKTTARLSDEQRGQSHPF